MSTELVVINTNEQHALAMGGLGFDGIESLRPTSMILVQPTSDVVGVMPGLFLDKLTGEQFAQLQMVPLAIHPTRAKYMSQIFVKGEKPTCRSRDGVFPITDNADLVAEAPNCKVCPHASWKGYNNKTKTGAKPTCKETYRITFIEKTTGLPYYMNVTGTSIPAVKALKEGIKRHAIMMNKRFETAKESRRLSIFDYVVTVGTEKSKGPYYNFKFLKTDPMRAEEAATFGPMYLELIQRKKQIDEEIDNASMGEVIEADAPEVM
jgi:hypothetical protein